jgi:2-C-methyl-D-erythritol 4-phosphate cytidylyltransferase
MDRALADAVVVAAGASRRMDGIDKLAHEVAGRPLLAWSIDALASSGVVGRVVVVTSPDRVAAIRAAPWLPPAVIAVVEGGDRRHESVAAGVAALDTPDDRVILVHDGARPLPTSALIAAVAGAAEEHGAAIPVLPVAETLKRLDGDVVAETVDRSGLAAAQTPQGARASSCAPRSSGFHRTAPRPGPMRPPCSRPVESPFMRFPANPPTSR